MMSWLRRRVAARRVEYSTLASWRAPSSFTALIPIRDVDCGVLRARLDALNEQFCQRASELDELHSFRLCAVSARKGTPFTSGVLLNSIYDGSLNDHLPNLVQRTGDLLAVSLQGAEGLGLGDLAELILRHRIFEQTLHLGSINRTAGQVREEQSLKLAVREFVRVELAKGVWSDETPPELIRRHVRDHFLTRPAGIVRTAAPALSRQARFRRFVDLVRVFVFFPFIGVLDLDASEALDRKPPGRPRWTKQLGYALWWLYGALPTAIAYGASRLLELTDHAQEAPPPDEKTVARLEASEDLTPMNAVTIVFEVRDRRLRRWFLRMILRGAEYGCRHIWTDGRLTRIETIHYARIMQIDDDHRLIFMSDYDGSLNRYLDDFLVVGARGVLPFTSNLVGCPRTRWLFGMGDPRTFAPLWKRMIRSYQSPISVWYSSYPGLTVREILNNAALRHELFAEQLSPVAVERWLRRL